MAEYDYVDLMNLVEKDKPVIKAPFIWLGGKTKTLKQLLPHIPYRKGFCDVFGGSGAVLLAREKSKMEVYNDRNSGVVDFYTVLKSDRYEEMMEWIVMNLHSRELFEDYTQAYVSTTDPIARAGMWYYLQQTSFAGTGTAWGRATSPRTINANKYYKNVPDFPRIHERLKDVQIENRDCLQILMEYDDPEMVFYLDPPYLNTHLQYKGPSWNRMNQLKLLKAIFACRGAVVLSGYNEPLNDKFPFDVVHEWPSRTSVRVDTGHVDVTREKVWIKY